MRRWFIPTVHEVTGLKTYRGSKCKVRTRVIPFWNGISFWWPVIAALVKTGKAQPEQMSSVYAPGITLPSPNEEREALSIASDEKRALPDARREITGRPKGK
jgi:hypothetical protein